MLGDQQIEALSAAARAGNTVAFRFGVAPLWVAVEDADPMEAAAVLERVLGFFAAVPLSATGQLAVLAVGMVERGAPHEPVAEVVSGALARLVPAAAGFAAAWRTAAGRWARLPDPTEGPGAYDDAFARLSRGRPWLRRPGLPVARAIELADGWFALTGWVGPAMNLLRLPGVLPDFPRRAELAAATEDLRQHRNDLDDLTSLLSPPRAPQPG
ncbi:hypothetical protein [Symbioplanes lichenis]|uniref:hypothetical protein n=1 Tax=Symbioplanes lichenis TaxID=1629072 RepID=UPI0027385B77|nr:hypothetical protein [Actinoplanes lichenis]